MAEVPVLSLRGLRVEFDTPQGVVQAVRGVDLDVMPGEAVGVVGESGSGKSVTFLATMGLLPRRARITGSATVGGVQLVGASRRLLNEVRGKRVAMIFQDPLSALNPVHRIGDQVVEMITAHQSIDRREADRRAVELLDTVGIPQPDKRARQFPHEFSGGMRQRVMIAMAIANNPEVLIADEPTTALDVTVQAQILDVITQIRETMRTAVVMITHDLGVVARVVDRVQVMYAGRVAERTDVDSLFTRPTHPYTEGLLHSIPRHGQDRLRPIAGSPPNMLRPPSGCPFAPRCRYVQERCTLAVPELVQFGGADSACVRIHEIQLEATA
jgi:oligopeptide/dipeptide ABC transporter ATP-binding protein